MEKLNEFEPVGHAAWLKLVEEGLKGASFDKKLVKRVAGLTVQPLYTRETSDAGDRPGLPGCAPFTRGTQLAGAHPDGWDVCAEVHAHVPKIAAEIACQELEGWATALLLRIRSATTADDDAEGVAIDGLADLTAALSAVQIEVIKLYLDAGDDALAAAAALIAHARERGIAPTALRGSLGLDPLASLAKTGSFRCSSESALREIASVARWAEAHAPNLRALTVDTSPYHDAGADVTQELAIALATSLSYLRALHEHGMSVSAAARQIVFRFSIGRDFFVEIAKLRAARTCWAKLVAHAGGDEDAQAMVIHAVTSWRTQTRRDPWVNLLRATAETFSAAAGGADVITTLGFDRALGASDELARRLARNTQHLLRHESHVHRVLDPAGGSWYVEDVTQTLGEHAWLRFQAFERSGGLLKALQDGSLQAELKQGLDAEQKSVQARKIAVTGVNEFPNVREVALVRERAKRHPVAVVVSTGAPKLDEQNLFESAVDAVAGGTSFAELRAALAQTPAAKVQKLARARLSSSFEALRDACDRVRDQTGNRPRIFLANLGPVAAHKARAGFAQNFFEAGGIEAITNEGFATPDEAAEAFATSGAEAAVICSSDEIYTTLAAQTGEALAARGAKAIALAGNPGANEAAYRESGVTDFIFVGADVYETLRALLTRLGAL
jgi:methylmalonyl-CoA mutase